MINDITIIFISKTEFLSPIYYQKKIEGGVVELNEVHQILFKVI